MSSRTVTACSAFLMFLRFAWAKPAEGHPTIARFSALAKELHAAIPVSFFEKAGHAYYNSLAMIDADGTVMGIYRKSHIPDGPGYEEKFYFRPGDTGFRAWDAKPAHLGVGMTVNNVMDAPMGKADNPDWQ